MRGPDPEQEALFAAASPAAWMLFSFVLGPLLTAALFVVENLARKLVLSVPRHFVPVVLPIPYSVKIRMPKFDCAW